MSKDDMQLIEQQVKALSVHVAPANAVAYASAAAKAGIEARFTVAMNRPRDMDGVRVRTLNTCRRPSFAANTSTLYNKPVGDGKTIEGPGIRMAEELARALTNVHTEAMLLHEDDEKQVFAITATDLEANVTIQETVSVAKLIERRSPREGQQVVGQRVTSKGNTVYIVKASDDEMLIKANALKSKALRTCILRLVPQDIVEEATQTVKKVRRDSAAKDPDAHRKQVCDAFAGMGVTPEMLGEYCGCPVRQITPEQIVELRGLFGSLRDGETTWAAIMDKGDDAPPPANGQKPPAPKSGMDRLREREGLTDTGGKIKITAKALAIATAAGLDPATVTPTGAGGKITLNDIQEALKTKAGAVDPIEPKASSAPAEAADEPEEEEESAPDMILELVTDGGTFDDNPAFTQVANVHEAGGSMWMIGEHQTSGALLCICDAFTPESGCKHTAFYQQRAEQ